MTRLPHQPCICDPAGITIEGGRVVSWKCRQCLLAATNTAIRQAWGGDGDVLPISPTARPCGCGGKCGACPPLTAKQVPTVRHLLYHVYPVAGDGIWQRGVEHLRKRIGLFNGRRVIGIATGRGLDSPDTVRAAFGGSVSEIVTATNMPDLREVSTLVPMLERIETTDPGHCFFWGHAKGVTRPSESSVHRWAEILYETCLDHWPLVEQLLATHAAAGSFKKVGKWFPESTSDWHFSGSFWWGRCDDVFKNSRWREPERKWWGAESYPSILFPHERAGAIFFESRSVVNLYSWDYLHRTVEPQYATWKQAHSPAPPQQPQHASGAWTGLNLGCGPHRAGDDWCNVDVTTNDLIRPDVVIRPGEPLPFAKASFDRCYLGHVMEHVPWTDLPALLAEVLRVVRPGGQVCVVGPDLFRSLDRLASRDAGAMEFVRGVLEDDRHHQDGQTEDWPGARHHWNCYEARVVRLLQAAGLWDVAPVPIHPENLAGWPVVDFSPWQCAVTARVP